MTTYKVTTLNDYGFGSLREGIKFANCNNNVTIIFSIYGTINLNFSLPNITNSVNIVGNMSSDGKILNTINGKKKYQILKIANTHGCVIQNLCLINSSHSGIFIYKSSCVGVYDCRIGITSNDCSQSNMYGIMIYKSYNNVIGSNPNLNQEYFSNVISGNTKAGIHIVCSKRNTIKNNIIGLSSDCTKKIPNGHGISLMNSNKNMLGGKAFVDNNGNINDPTGEKGTVTPVFVRPLEGNIISGNLSDGIHFNNSNNNTIPGNFIGTDNTGILNFGNSKNGIFLYKSDFNFITGCGIDSNPFIYYNVIGWNSNNGIQVHCSNYTTIQGNFLGIAANNSNAIPNLNGLKVSGTSLITAVGGKIPLGNVIAGNKNNGIYLTDKINGFNTVNTFCGLKAFGDALPNLNGILIDNNAHDIKINTNIISGNNENGIVIKGNANNILIGNNIIGLNTETNSPLPNKSNGIKISENANNIFDGIDIPSVIPQNTISSNYEYGLLLEGNVCNVILQLSSIGLSTNNIDTFSNLKGGILVKDRVHDCLFGNSFNFLRVYDEFNFAIKLGQNTHNNTLTYVFVNTNTNNDTLPHNQNIINLSTKNNLYGNALPVK